MLYAAALLVGFACGYGVCYLTIRQQIKRINDLIEKEERSQSSTLTMWD